MPSKPFSALIALACGLFAVRAPAQDQFRPLYLSGKVVLSTGGPPPTQALIELRCGESRQPQQHTDSKGSFNFRVGGEPSRGVADSQRTSLGTPVGASGSDRSFVSLTGCELEASLAGYSSSKIYLGRRSVFESADVGTIILTPLGKSAGLFVSENTANAPENARRAYERAEAEMAKGHPDTAKAIKDLKKAAEAYPQFSAAWNLLGKARLAEKDTDGARDAFQKAMAADPKFVPPRLSLALLELQAQRMEQAAKLADDALKLIPDLPEAHYYRGMAHLSLGLYDTAEISIRIVQDSADAGRYPRTHFMLGNILAQKGDVPNAATEFRRFLEVEPSSRAAEAARKQLAEWQAAGLLK